MLQATDGKGVAVTANDPPTAAETEREEAVADGTDSGVGKPGVSRDDLFDVLSNHRRRYALHSLKQRDGGTDIGDLAEEIAAWENDVSIAELTAADRKRVYTALQQFHVPKMDAAGIVEFDSVRGTVTLTEASTNLDVYLDVVTDDMPWSRYYLGLSSLSLALVTSVWFEIAPFDTLPALAWMALIALAFTGSSLVHVYRSRRLRLGSDGPPPDLEKR